MDIQLKLQQEFSLKQTQVENVIKLIDEGNTIPFIARYRKEMTGSLDDQLLRTLSERLAYLRNLEDKRTQVKNTITEQGNMTEELEQKLSLAETMTEIEDIYRPFRPKRRTRATIAKEKGLEPFADLIWLQIVPDSIENMAKDFIDTEKGVETIDDAVSGAKDIIAERISDDADLRKMLRTETIKNGYLTAKASDENIESVYEMYYDYHERVNRIVSHRILAINRAENEKVIAVNIVVDKDFLTQYINRGVTKNRNSSVNEYLSKAVEDSLNRLLLPSIEREVRSELTEKASEQALKVFSINLEKLLMQAPLKDKMVLGLDPAYRTGCKLAVVDQTGKVLKIDKVFITIPKANYDKEKKVLLDIIKKYSIEIIAIGNGTASRESEAFISQLIKDNNLNVDYAIISEAGASVYSASKLAKEEFPDYQVEERSAVSIARRLQDPLAELVKIEPKAISVGQYQHDIAQKQLEEQLDFVVEKAVNNVGVDINTASVSLLQYVAGLNAGVAKNIIKYRDENGKFTNRKEIMNVSKLGAKTYQQAIGFLRIPGANDPFDATAIHPENYQQAKKLLELIGANESVLGTKEIAEKLGNLNKEEIMNELQIDSYTLDDIIDSFIKPNRSPRDNYATPLLKKDILKIDDLKPGMVLEGTVRNVVDFGAFIDIGLKNDGLVHISKISHERIKHPLDKLSIGDIVEVYVIDVDINKHRVGLSMIKD